MEIEIGGRSEKSLGGQESDAVGKTVWDPMQARAVLPCHSLFDCLFFAGTCLMSGAGNSP